jgi:hypothetical protein
VKDFTLTAHYGDGASATIFSDAYPAHRNPAHQWVGVTSLVVPAGEWVPPVTCAYQFRLSAHPRVTNGYTYIGYVEDTYHVTLIKPGRPAAPVMTRLIERRLPFGQSIDGASPTSGSEPEKLGAKTIR